MKEKISTTFASLIKFNNFISINAKNIIADGEYVVVESISKNSSWNENSGTSALCDIYHIKQGKIHELTTYIIDTTSPWIIKQE